MKMIKHILVASDASPAATRAVRMAAQIADKFDARLKILYVVRDMQLPPEIKRMAEIEKIQGDRDTIMKVVAESALKDAKAQAQRDGATDVSTRVASGDPANEILRAAREEKADLIVLGTRGLGEVQGMLLGSVSRKVSNLLPGNCLIVH
jgi:nucleotide-binding universal stress UspA family protein